MQTTWNLEPSVYLMQLRRKCLCKIVANKICWSSEHFSLTILNNTYYKKVVSVFYIILETTVN